jgi:hypothetical protein
MSHPVSPSDVGAGVHKSNEPAITDLVWRAHRLAFTDTEFLRHVSWQTLQLQGEAYEREAQISTVGTSLIPSLHSSTYGADDDGEVECRRVPPAVSCLKAERFTLLHRQALNMIVARRILGNKRSSLDEVNTFIQTPFIAKDLDIVHEISVRDVCQRVGDS